MRRVLIWVLLSGLALALAVLIARHDQNTIAGLSNNDFASLAYNLALIVFLGGAVLVMFREKLSKALEAALLWIVIGLMLAFGYTYRNELRGIPIKQGDTLASIIGEERVETDLPLLAGDSLRSKIKQVASGRFGVTAEYLAIASGELAKRRPVAAGITSNAVINKAPTTFMDTATTRASKTNNIALIRAGETPST